MKAQCVLVPQGTADNNSPVSPMWLRKEQALRLFNIGWRRLEQWRLDGFIRSAKLGRGRTSTRLYLSSDLSDLLLSLAAGRKPAIRQGRTIK